MTTNSPQDATPRWGRVPTEIKPGFVLPILDDEIDFFEQRANRFRVGDETEDQFRLFRLAHGTYGQRQADEQMMRVKLPYGGVTADQMDVFATVAEEYSELGRGHITTRQNFQFHFVKLEHAATVMRIIGEVGLTTREACAHTVRNITGCDHAGVWPTEVFDATPYLAAYGRYMIRNPICQMLPRKFKSAFSSCTEDCAGTPIHDIGFIATIRKDASGNDVRGFRIVVGGGLSTMPRPADTVVEFAEADNGDYIRASAAILKVFDREGGMPGLLRKNLNKARIKFLLHRIGVEEFQKQVNEELAQDWAKEPIDVARLSQLSPEGPTEGDLPPLTEEPDAGFAEWVRTNVTAQKQPGYSLVTVVIPIGNIYPDQFRALATIMRRYSGGNARTNQAQDLVLRWVRNDALAHVYNALKAIGFATSGAGLISDVVSCPGADSCKLAITASNQAGYAMRDAIINFDYKDPEVQKIQVKISGCPNGCGQHHVAGIGLQGSSYKAGRLEVPCYDLFIGGGGYVGGDRMGTRVSRVLAKKAHLAIDKVTKVYQAERQQGETFLDYVDRVGPKSFESHLEEFKWVAPINIEPDMYMDWGSEEVFQVIRGEGECAAGAVPVRQGVVESVVNLD